MRVEPEPGTRSSLGTRAPAMPTEKMALQPSSRGHANGRLDTMKTTIDKAGRLVIPRNIRDRIGLADGGEVELELDGAAVRIEPVSTGELVEEGGLLFIPRLGEPITDEMVRDLIDADRHQR